jgi:hypothetical protein
MGPFEGMLHDEPREKKVLDKRKTTNLEQLYGKPWSCQAVGT